MNGDVRGPLISSARKRIWDLLVFSLNQAFFHRNLGSLSSHKCSITPSLSARQIDGDSSISRDFLSVFTGHSKNFVLETQPLPGRPCSSLVQERKQRHRSISSSITNNNLLNSRHHQKPLGSRVGMDGDQVTGPGRKKGARGPLGPPFGPSEGPQTQGECRLRREGGSL